MSTPTYNDGYANTIEDQLNYAAQQPWFSEFITIVCSSPRGNLACRSIIDVFQWPMDTSLEWSARNKEIVNLIPVTSGGISFDSVYELIIVRYSKEEYPEYYI